MRETRTSLLDTSEMTWPINWAAILSVGPGQQGPASEARRLVEGRPAGAARRARGEARTVVSRFQALALGARFRTAWTRLSEIVVVQQRWRSASLAPAAGARTASTPDRPLERSPLAVMPAGCKRGACSERTTLRSSRRRRPRRQSGSASPPGTSLRAHSSDRPSERAVSLGASAPFLRLETHEGEHALVSHRPSSEHSACRIPGRE